MGAHSVPGGEHDWFYLLSATGHLPQDLAVARAIRAAGVIIVVGATVLGFIAAARPVESDVVPSNASA